MVSCLDGWYLTSMVAGTTVDTYRSYQTFSATAEATDANNVGAKCVGKISYLYVIHSSSLFATMQDLCLLQQDWNGCRTGALPHLFRRMVYANLGRRLCRYCPS